MPIVRGGRCLAVCRRSVLVGVLNGGSGAGRGAARFIGGVGFIGTTADAFAVGLRRRLCRHRVGQCRQHASRRDRCAGLAGARRRDVGKAREQGRLGVEARDGVLWPDGALDVCGVSGVRRTRRIRCGRGGKRSSRFRTRGVRGCTRATCARLGLARGLDLAANRAGGNACGHRRASRCAHCIQNGPCCCARTRGVARETRARKCCRRSR